MATSCVTHSVDDLKTSDHLPLTAYISYDACLGSHNSRKRVRWCAAKSEHVRVQRRDRLFATQDHRQYMTPQRKKARCSKLFVDGEVVWDPETLLNVWVNHFRKLTGWGWGRM